MAHYVILRIILITKRVTMVLNGFAVFVRNVNGKFIRVINPPVEVFEDDKIMMYMMDPYMDVMETYVGKKVYRVVRLDLVRPARYVGGDVDPDED